MSDDYEKDIFTELGKDASASNDSNQNFIKYHSYSSSKDSSNTPFLIGDESSVIFLLYFVIFFILVNY